MPASGLAQSATPMRNHGAHHSMGAEATAGAAVPIMPGQDAFGTIQEIVRLLEADPSTDWSKVDINVLREHLVDMAKVTLDARVTATLVEGGARFEVTGDGRTREAIQRMVPAHAREIDGMNGWAAKADPLSGGVALTVTSADPKQTAKIRGLGFFGILTEGSHHQMHHLAMARGEFTH
jgi:predicted RNA binding protein YcfA (HicA-like mRNA interferase family)